MTDLESFINDALGNEAYPNIHQLENMRMRALWVLLVAKDKNIDYLSLKEISDLLTETIGLRSSPQAIGYALGTCKGEVARKKINGKLSYTILERGRKKLAEIQDLGGAIIFVSGTQYTSKRLLKEKLLAQLSPPVYICDPYLGIGTLAILSVIPKKFEVNFLCQKVESSIQFDKDFSDFKKEFPNCVFRKYTRNELHDRYILDSRSAWQIGHSLKDLGEKDTIASPLGVDIRQSVLELFNRRWKVAEVI
ncbi:MAG: hypothetical protein NT130_04570 [Candidatus Micrarchaeota archaeon]|nr:hypothetical protein [Candidatus Micrarchaeota archaeon]